MDLPEQDHPLGLGVAALLPGEFYAVISKHGPRPVAPWKENSGQQPLRTPVGVGDDAGASRGASLTIVKNGAPEEIRTPDPQIRSLVLYPAELRALCAWAG